LMDSFIVVVVEPVELWAAGGRKALLRVVCPPSTNPQAEGCDS
jgi:hypothetical protein